jgi:hypothetical protein
MTGTVTFDLSVDGTQFGSAQVTSPAALADMGPAGVNIDSVYINSDISNNFANDMYSMDLESFTITDASA